MGKVVSSTFNEFVNSMNQKGKDVSQEALKYPAAPVWPPDQANYRKVTPSVNAGVKLLVQTLLIRAKACPIQRFILAGYSQGAWVIQWTMSQLSSALRSMIGAVLLYGDPYFNPKDKFATGSYSTTLHGILGATNIPVSIARSYCVTGDPVCNASAINALTCRNAGSNCVHFSYVNYATQAANWLASVFGYSVRIERVYVADGSGKAKTTFTCGQTVQYRVALVNITTVTKQVLLRFSVAKVGSSIYESSGTVNTGPGVSTHFPITTIPKGVSGKYAFVIAATDDYAGTSRATEFTVTC